MGGRRWASPRAPSSPGPPLLQLLLPLTWATGPGSPRPAASAGVLSQNSKLLKALARTSCHAGSLGLSQALCHLAAPDILPLRGEGGRTCSGQAPGGTGAARDESGCLSI